MKTYEYIHASVNPRHLLFMDAIKISFCLPPHPTFHSTLAEAAKDAVGLHQWSDMDDPFCLLAAAWLTMRAPKFPAVAAGLRVLCVYACMCACVCLCAFCLLVCPPSPKCPLNPTNIA